MKKAEELFVWVNALISRSIDPIWKVIPLLNSSVIEEGYD